MDYSSSVNQSDVTEKENLPKKDRQQSFRLYSFDAIPEYLQSNPYIRTGYRYGLTAKGCLIRYLNRFHRENNRHLFTCSSLLYLNNETVNIWSHLIGAGLFIYFFFRDIYRGKALPLLTTTSDYYFVLFYTFSVIVNISIISLVIALIFSVL